MQKLLLYHIHIKGYEMLNITMHDIIWNNYNAEIWALKDLIYVYFYGPIKN